MRHRAILFALALVFAVVPGLSAARRAGFELSVVVDGCEAPEYEHGGKLYVEALRGRDFTLRLFNPTGERVAVALSVDGRNVVDAKRTGALEATKWILSPGQTLEIPGWQVSGETSRRFFFTETGRSYAKWLGDTRNVGTIEAVFFRERRRDALLESPAPLESPPPVESRSGIREEAPPAGARAPAPKSTGEAADLRPLREANPDRFAATGIGERSRFAVRWVQFEEDPDPAARIALRYEFRRELIRLSVLPRDEDLYARERGRGFEPGYAPDPYRNR
jgi:hypothetical protein